jgi:hypothetical protein
MLPDAPEAIFANVTVCAGPSFTVCVVLAGAPEGPVGLGLGVAVAAGRAVVVGAGAGVPVEPGLGAVTCGCAGTLLLPPPLHAQRAIAKPTPVYITRATLIDRFMYRNVRSA